MSVKKPRVFHFARVNEVLVSAEGGRRTAGKIVADWDPRADLVLNFKRVKAATPPFLEGVVIPLSGPMRTYEEAIVAAIGMNEDVRQSLEFLLERTGLALAAVEDGDIELLNGAAPLRKTLREAQRLGDGFQATDLAKALAIKPANLHQRLNALMEAGAIARKRDDQPGRGRRFAYTVADPERLQRQKLEPIAAK